MLPDSKTVHDGSMYSSSVTTGDFERYVSRDVVAWVDGRYRAIAIDVGDQDRLRDDTARLHDMLEKYGIAHTFEVYPGTHTSRVADRFQNHVMKFFSESLCFEAGGRR